MAQRDLERSITSPGPLLRCIINNRNKKSKTKMCKESGYGLEFGLLLC